MKTSKAFFLVLSIICICTSPIFADVIGGVNFPQGAISFADSVVSYNPVIIGGQPTDPHRGAFNALGLPNYAGDNSCANQPDCTFVSLGDGGSIVLEFIDNKLTGSGNTDLDLWIFEVGPDVEDMFVDISKDGTTWSSIGAVGGSTAGINIDAYGFGPSDIFAYVRLTDDEAKDAQSGNTVGADIDAVGAITTISTPQVPEPTSIILLGTGLGAIGLATWRRRK
jgi:hypothetical protein